jgi:AraC-like DNA-binding protein
MSLGFIEILKVFTVFQIFLVFLFLLRNFSGKSKKNLLLSIFIISKALSILDSLFISHWRELPLFFTNFIALGSGCQFLLGPALYLIIVETTRRKIVFEYKHLLHLIPFGLYTVLVISQFQIHDYATKTNLLQNWFPYSMLWNKISCTLMYFLFDIYGIASLIELSRSKTDIYKVYSQSVERNIFYLKFLIYDFMIVWGINMISWYVNYGQPWSYILWVITVLNIFFIANAVVYQGLKFPETFQDEVLGKQKYEKNALSDSEKDEYIKKLKEYMDEHKPYLNPTLSLTDLANELGMPSFALSQVLNLKAGQNFYEFINNYRIEESKRLLAESSQNGKTILEILYQCGFNSKSVFNSAFRKYTSMTPSEFKKFSTYQLQ